MKERPILFSGEMVRAILDGKKTQTRRVAKVTSDFCRPGMITPVGCHCPRSLAEHSAYCPYGKLYDRLWVRESWYQCIDNNDTFRFVADGPPPTTDRRHYKRRASIHLPRRGARIVLEITDIRVERLQDIGEEDARAEGIVDGGCLTCGESEPCGCGNPKADARDAFAGLWQSIYGETPGKTWDDNPHVWVIEFRRVSDEH